MFFANSCFKAHVFTVSLHEAFGCGVQGLYGLGTASLQGLRA